ncbi:MAG: cytochrome c oxidase subunit 3 [Elusimicrobia bacterium]|nr:cytochrome c oxidase subunit 3 [Elusimicrobiota bacterium]
MEGVLQHGTLGEEREDPGKLGLWLFILSEVLLFGGFFSSYIMTRWGSSVCALGAPAWPEGTAHTTMRLAALNTFILITSSYTAVRALSAVKRGAQDAFRRNLGATVLLGLAFLVVKAFEYSVKIGHGFTPGGEFALANPGYRVFFSFYFLMTGLHGLHVVVGLIWNTLLLRSQEDPASEPFGRKVEYAALYWHFVDVVWVFLFPLFYLV